MVKVFFKASEKFECELGKESDITSEVYNVSSGRSEIVLKNTLSIIGIGFKIVLVLNEGICFQSGSSKFVLKNSGEIIEKNNTSIKIEKDDEFGLIVKLGEATFKFNKFTWFIDIC